MRLNYRTATGFRKACWAACHASRTLKVTNDDEHVKKKCFWHASNELALGEAAGRLHYSISDVSWSCALYTHWTIRRLLESWSELCFSGKEPFAFHFGGLKHVEKNSKIRQTAEAINKVSTKWTQTVSKWPCHTALRVLQMFKAMHKQAKRHCSDALEQRSRRAKLSSTRELVEVWDQKTRKKKGAGGEGTLIVQTTHRLWSGREHTRWAVGMWVRHTGDSLDMLRKAGPLLLGLWGVAVGQSHSAWH